jgi:hypothetical protein
MPSSFILLLASTIAADPSPQGAIDVGAAAVEISADGSMTIGGGILGWKSERQEGKLRAVAVVLRLKETKLAIVACDVLMLTRDLLDPAVAEITRECGIPGENILVNATHTHHAPSTVTVHGYERDEVFCKRTQQAIVAAVRQANAGLAPGRRLFFRLGEESSVGQNSRLLLKDGTIFWIGPRDDAVRPTGPFDPELPVLAFKDDRGKIDAMIFNHSTHTIGTRNGATRSPSFYGLAAQELEAELGGVVSFLEGASGSTHNLTVGCDEMVHRVKTAVKEAIAKAEPRPVLRLAARKKPIVAHVRKFDEQQQQQAVAGYCRKRSPQGAETTIEVFRKMRQRLAPLQGTERKTWIQALVIGDVAFVGVPAEFFTVLGEDIKRRSPFRYTYVAELANDWIGYTPDRKGFELGGYQTWMGLHSYTEIGTGEALVDAAVDLLKELSSESRTP